MTERKYYILNLDNLLDSIGAITLRIITDEKFSKGNTYTIITWHSEGKNESSDYIGLFDGDNLEKFVELYKQNVFIVFFTVGGHWNLATTAKQHLEYFNIPQDDQKDLSEEDFKTWACISYCQMEVLKTHAEDNSNLEQALENAMGKLKNFIHDNLCDCNGEKGIIKTIRDKADDYKKIFSNIRSQLPEYLIAKYVKNDTSIVQKFEQNINEVKKFLV